MSGESALVVAERLIERHDLSLDVEEVAAHIRLARLAGADDDSIQEMVYRIGEVKTATDDHQAEEQGILVHEMPDDVLPDDS